MQSQENELQNPRPVINRVQLVISFFFVIFFFACDSHLAGEPPLHRAAYTGNVDEIVKLINEGEKVNSLNGEGATPLHWAAFKGQTDAARALLRYGADVNARTKKGSTPLRLAKTHKNKEVIKLLQAHGGTDD